MADAVALGQLADELHDRWFHGDQLEWKDVDATLSLPFTDRWQLREGWRIAPPESQFDQLLIVQNVLSWQVFDQAKIGFYDLDDLTFDERSRELTLHSGFPYRLVARVSSLSVRYRDGGLQEHQDG